MKKRIQNKVAESKLTLPSTTLYAIVIWLVAGLLTHHWWLLFGCFAVNSLLMMELNNRNALLRIYSRMVSSSFIALSCCACFLFPQTQGAWMLLCVTASYIILFQSYQDSLSMGKTYYAFLFLGLASFDFVYILFYVPFIWLMMSKQFQTLSWRTWGASLLGLLTPYWFGVCWMIYTDQLSLLTGHIQELISFEGLFDYASIPHDVLFTLAWLGVLYIIGTIHYINKSYGDKIRIRMFYQFFMWMNLLSILFLIVLPAYHHSFIRLMILNTAPLIAHFMTLTSTKLTNIAFWAISIITVMLTLFNLWNLLSLY